MSNKLLQNYREILYEISGPNDRDIINIDLWDILAAAFLAAFLTVAALGAGWIAYYIILSLTSTITLSSGIGISATCMDWLKVKENRILAQKNIKEFLNGNFGTEMQTVSIQSIKVLHTTIKKKLIDFFNEPKQFEEYLIN